MKFKVFSVYDSKVGVYSQPRFIPTVGAALRAWIDTVNDPSTPMHKHPGDYTFFELGEFDEETGQFSNLATPLSRGVAIEALIKEERVPSKMADPVALEKYRADLETHLNS